MLNYVLLVSMTDHVTTHKNKLKVTQTRMLKLILNVMYDTRIS